LGLKYTKMPLDWI